MDEQQVYLSALHRWTISRPLTPISFLVDPYIANYLHSHWTDGVNAQSVADTTAYDGTHTTDVTNKKALDMIDEAASDGKQFFMMVAPGECQSVKYWDRY